MAEVYSDAVDKGLEGVVACSTGVSSIVDATLCYCGYRIEELAEHSSFEETIFLLWNQRLPKKDELKDLQDQLRKEMELPKDLLEYLKGLPAKDVHPMAWLRSAVSIMAHWDKEAQDMSEEANQRKAIRLTAKMGSLVCAFEAIRNNRDFVKVNPEKSMAWNFMHMLKGQEPDPEHVKIFDTCLILHADHELNCSAFSARVTASSLSDVYSAVVSAIGTLKGPLHGGANEQVMLMLKKIGSPDKVKDWVMQAFANKEKIMGFGHRVYKNGDPRAKILRNMSKEMTERSPEPHWFEMSTLMDDIVQKEKGLLPNVDFYSATVYYSMGIPIDIYTPIFATSRISGWLAHIFEQYSKNRIYRPRGQWVGNDRLQYVSIDKR